MKTKLFQIKQTMFDDLEKLKKEINISDPVCENNILHKNIEILHTKVSEFIVEDKLDEAVSHLKFQEYALLVKSFGAHDITNIKDRYKKCLNRYLSIL